MAQDETVQLLGQIREAVDAIRLDIAFLSRGAILEVLQRVATTPERQHMWRLCDGTRSTEQIGRDIGVTLRSVQYFIQEAQDENLVFMERRAYPKRIKEIIPADWKPWKAKPVRKDE